MRIATGKQKIRHRKGQMQYSGAMMGVEVIVTAVLLFTLYQIVSNVLQPHFQIAYANAELLRSTIDGLCEQGSGSVSIDDWKFPQPIPVTMTVKNVDVAKNLVPKFMIKSRGDPYFLLYYEAFSPPQAFPWEVYENVGDRIIMPLRRTEDNITDAKRTVENEVLAPTRAATGVNTVLIPNIILDNTTAKQTNFPGSDGTWKSENLYSLGTYDLLPEVEKSLIKYRVCGDHALCMKTRQGVITLPLPNCKKNGYDYIQLDRSVSDILETMGMDALGDAGLGALDYSTIKGSGMLATFLAKNGLFKLLPAFGARFFGRLVPYVGWGLLVWDLINLGEAVATGVISSFMNFQTDFYMASPCEVGLDISIGTCSCDALQTTKLYAYDQKTDTLNAVGDYKTCWDRVDNATGEQTTDIPCVKVFWRNKRSGFCAAQNAPLPAEGFSTIFKLAAGFENAFQAVRLKSGTNLAPGFLAALSGWVWPGENTL